MSGDGFGLLSRARSLIRAKGCAYVDGTDGLKLTMIAEKFGGDF